ncbi:hypothetical protein E4U37_004578, partial [Claviceps purpurea]
MRQARTKKQRRHGSRRPTPHAAAGNTGDTGFDAPAAPAFSAAIFGHRQVPPYLRPGRLGLTSQIH